MSFLVEPILTGIAGAFIGNLFKPKQSTATPYQMPPNIVIDNTSPGVEPIAPPNAPLDPSVTAALQRARASRGGGGQASGNSDIVLSSPQSRREDEGAVRRATLLGGPAYCHGLQDLHRLPGSQQGTGGAARALDGLLPATG